MKPLSLLALLLAVTSASCGMSKGRSHRTTRNRFGVDMANQNAAVSLLRAKRKELLDQLDAVHKALAALGSLGVAFTTTPEGNPQEAAEKAASCEKVGVGGDP